MIKHAFILDSMPGKRHLDARKSQPSAFQTVVDAPILQWLNRALQECEIESVTYVGSYHIEKVIQSFPNFQYCYYSQWDSDGEVAALIKAGIQFSDNCIIIRSNTLLLPTAIKAMINAENPAYGIYATSDGQHNFAGIITLGNDSIGYCKHLSSNNISSSLETLIQNINNFQAVNLDKMAAPTSDRWAINRTVFRGKAQTLEQLSLLSRQATIMDQVRFTVESWHHDSADIINKIFTLPNQGNLVVRSSAVTEDTPYKSSAGYFHTEMNVPAGNNEAIRIAIEQVIYSYKRDNRRIQMLDQVLVQEQVENISFSGVMLTRDFQMGAPYFVINIESDSGRSDVVTSGGEGNLKTYYVSWHAKNSDMDRHIIPVFKLGKELIDICQNDALYIEFGMDTSEVLYLFQVRPIPDKLLTMQVEDDDLFDFIEGASHFIAGKLNESKYVYGSKTIFGNMPDWNPAEIIGATPHPLALSLYQYLIGDRSWSQARTRIGYMNVESVPLIISIGGKPYVDVRASLNSLLPAGLNSNFSRQWVDHGINLLTENKALHDKIEFEIAITCLAPDWGNRKTELFRAGFLKNDIADFKSRLRILTERIISNESVTFESLKADLKIMSDRRRNYVAEEKDSLGTLAMKAKMLLDDCKQFGIIPFSIFARYAFISMTFLRGFRSTNILSSEDYDKVMMSIPTVSRTFVNDAKLFKSNKLSINYMNDKYGHLRPNSYEITAKNYSQDPEFFRNYISDDINYSKNIFKSSECDNIFSEHHTIINKTLKNLGFQFDNGVLLKFIKKSISGREAAKFEFMKNVNSFLELTAEIGKRLELDRLDMAHLKAHEILELATNSASGATSIRLKRASGYRKKRMELSRALRVPDVISDAHQVNAFSLEDQSPNFITSKSIVASIIYLKEFKNTIELSGCIVAIRAADPGFDWIFSRQIAGLITEYGGVASHMAIRAAEFGIPAAVGCGGVIFNKLIEYRQVKLDCLNQRVTPFQ
jgi:phosphohistidine swiveling domain-containing protein